jgi:hypothetical protein
VCEPNEWKPRFNPFNGIDTPEKRLLLEYWTDFVEFLHEHESSLKIRDPRPLNYMSFPIGRTDMFLSTQAYPKNNKIGVQIYLKGGDGRAKDHFELLQDERNAIENTIGSKLEWNDSRKKERSIELFKNNVDVQNRANWPEQYQWLYKELELFYKAFAERVKDYPSESTRCFTSDETEQV